VTITIFAFFFSTEGKKGNKKFPLVIEKETWKLTLWKR
jgi:hypothetical protein